MIVEEKDEFETLKAKPEEKKRAKKAAEKAQAKAKKSSRADLS